MFGIINKLKIVRRLNGIGDPGILVPYVEGLENEIKSLKLIKEDLEKQLGFLENLLDNKTAHIQCLEAVNRASQ